MKIQVPMIAMTHCEAAKVQEKFPNAANGFLCPTQWVETSPNRDKYFGAAADWNTSFKAAYSKYYPTTVPYQSAQASAAVVVWKDSFERANSFDKVKVREAIASTKLETFYGNIKFSKNGNNIAKPMFMRQIDASAKYNAVITPDDLIHPRKANY